MIEDLIRVFEKRYKMYGDDLLLEDYKLEDGIYVLYNLNKSDKPLTEFEVSKENSCVDNKYYKNINIKFMFNNIMQNYFYENLSGQQDASHINYSTVTLFARFLGISTLLPSLTEISSASS